MKLPPGRKHDVVFLQKMRFHARYLLLIPSHTVPFSNQDLPFILAFDRLVNIPISDSSAPPLPRTHTHTHTHTQDQKQTKQKKSAFLRFTCQDGARHSYWIVKNLFCFCVKGRSFQGVNVSELEFIWKRSEERRVGKECRSRWSPYH